MSLPPVRSALSILQGTDVAEIGACAPGVTTTVGAVDMSIDSAALLRGRSEVQIVHRGVPYRLKQTSLGKLILTK